MRKKNLQGVCLSGLSRCDIKKYKLIDYYEGYGVVGEYDTIEEMKEAAYNWMLETDGECDLSYRRRCEECGKYHEITV